MKHDNSGLKLILLITCGNNVWLFQPRKAKQLRDKYALIKGDIRVKVSDDVQREREEREEREFKVLQRKEEHGQTLTKEEREKRKALKFQLSVYKKHLKDTGGGPPMSPPQFTHEEEQLIETTKLTMVGLPAWYGSDMNEEVTGENPFAGKKKHRSILLSIVHIQ